MQLYQMLVIKGYDCFNASTKSKDHIRLLETDAARRARVTRKVNSLGAVSRRENKGSTIVAERIIQRRTRGCCQACSYRYIGRDTNRICDIAVVQYQVNVVVVVSARGSKHTTRAAIPNVYTHDIVVWKGA
ncbi:hypothetical protein QAD02_020040 [Eretmocerus hayati]|uniref:Uncharacterized protein n=1 Tax=Eretmocerus hayati TaxID=131215 RepID=A0ACC2PLD7_9HYME|nr:hypothetical protein QAD02_020040 [Eretmocerus hayati]